MSTFKYLWERKGEEFFFVNLVSNIQVLVDGAIKKKNTKTIKTNFSKANIEKPTSPATQSSGLKPYNSGSLSKFIRTLYIA